MKFCAKSFAAGVIVAVVGVSSVFAASAIKSAQFNTNKVVFDGKEINMTANPMISIVKEGETAASNYMPLRAVLEAMGYEIGWDGATNTVSITTKGTAQTAPAPAPAEDVTDKIVGYWAWVDTDGTAIKYHFAADGHFESYTELHLTNGQVDKNLLDGSYKVSGNKVTLTFDGEKADAPFEVKFAADGKSWSSYVEALDAEMVFKADNDTTWDAHDEDIAKKIVGYWSFADTDGSLVNYYFAADGKFVNYNELHLTDGKIEKSTEKGTYKIDDHVVSLKFDSDKLKDLNPQFAIKFAADGKSWSSYEKAIDTTLVFKATTDTSWAK